MSSLNTSPHLQTSALHELGLLDAKIRRPVAVVGRRKSARSRPREREFGFDAGLYAAGSRPAIPVGTMLVQACAATDRDVLRVHAPGAPVVEVTAAGRGPTAWAPEAADGRSVIIEPSEDTAYTVVRADGTGVLVVHERGKGIVAYELQRSAPQEGAPSSLTIVVPPWLEAVRPSWLHADLQRHIQASTAYSITAAVGAYSRLAQTADDDATAALSLLLAGLEDPETDRGHRWFDGLSTAVRRAIWCAAVAHAHALSDAIQHALQVAKSGSSRVDTSALRRLRDDLEGVRGLLAAPTAEDELERALREVDQGGDKLAHQDLLTAPPAALQARLDRVGTFDPDAWWC